MTIDTRIITEGIREGDIYLFKGKCHKVRILAASSVGLQPITDNSTDDFTARYLGTEERSIPIFHCTWKNLDLGSVNFLKPFPELLLRLIIVAKNNGIEHPLLVLARDESHERLTFSTQRERVFWTIVFSNPNNIDLLDKASSAVYRGDFIIESSKEINQIIEEKNETELQNKRTPVRDGRRAGSIICCRRHKAAVTIGSLSNKEIHCS